MLKVYACKKDLWVEPTGRDGEISFTPYAEAEDRVRELEALLGRCRPYVSHLAPDDLQAALAATAKPND